MTTQRALVVSPKAPSLRARRDKTMRDEGWKLNVNTDVQREEREVGS